MMNPRLPGMMRAMLSLLLRTGASKLTVLDESGCGVLTLNISDQPR